MGTQRNPTTGLVLNVLGPTIEFLTDPNEAGDGLRIPKGTLAPGVIIPLHAHADLEEFFGFRWDVLRCSMLWSDDETSGFVGTC